MNFEEAVKLLKEGKKIHRPKFWDVDSYWYIGKGGMICWRDGTPAKVRANQLVSDNWEEYQEDDWNLYNTERRLVYGNSYHRCSDIGILKSIIIRDINKIEHGCYTEGIKIEIIKIIKKRFGF
tara:strand:+ start:187 stop:555 length:369 start_codon:yes stop_codon:yes gene_type:complete